MFQEQRNQLGDDPLDLENDMVIVSSDCEAVYDVKFDVVSSSHHVDLI